MFCKYCGFQCADDAIFCSKCGKSISSEDTLKPCRHENETDSECTADRTSTPSQNIQIQHCPKCGSTNVKLINEVNTTGSNYGAAEGCLGYLIMGPLGLLCGLCGANQKTTNKLSWVCDDCGEKFDRQQDIEAAKEEDERLEQVGDKVGIGFFLIFGIPLAVLSLALILGAIIDGMEELLAVGIPGLAIGLVFLFLGLKKKKDFKKKHSNENGAESSANDQNGLNE